MKSHLDHIRAIRIPIACLLLSALLVWFITPDFHRTDSSAAYCKRSGEKVTLQLEFERSVQAHFVAKVYTAEAPNTTLQENATASIQVPGPARTPALKALYSTVEINAP
jgi:hypothetical protein